MQQRPEHPNLVFVLTDRQRQDTMACYGNQWVQTPNLNRLAEESLVFDHCYVTQPVCAPARASLFSGLYPPAAGMPVNRLVMPANVPTVGEMLGGPYRKAYFGKWHLGDEIFRQRGFDEWLGCHDIWWPEYRRESSRRELSAYHHWLVSQGFEPDAPHPAGRMFSDRARVGLPAQYQIASYLGQQAAAFIRANRERPFVLFVCCIEPHPPFVGPYDHLHDPTTLPVDDTFLVPPEGHSLFNRLRADFWRHAAHDDIPLDDEAGWRRLRASYYGYMKLVDDMVGTITAAIDDAGVRERTALVYTSEHGDMVGTHGLLEMRTPYEEASVVPLLVRAPWLATVQRRIGGNFSQIDMLPTMLDLLGETIPGHLHGESRLDVLRGEADLAGNDIVLQHNGIGDRDLTIEASAHQWPREKVEQLNWLKTIPWRTLVSRDRFKLTLCACDQGELFDLDADPGETTNLFDRPEHRDRIRLMAARLRVWQGRYGDSAPLPAV